MLMSVETVTFENFAPEKHDIGASVTGLGVIPEMALVFGHNLDPVPNAENLGSLIQAVGQSKELQQNLPRIQEVLGTDQNGLSIAHGWVEQSGLLVPTERSFMDPNLPLPGAGDNPIALMTGGVRNWMRRRAVKMLELTERGVVKSAVLAVGKRAMRRAEGPDVRDGMTEADYMDEMIVPILEEAGVSTTLLRVDSADGTDVMTAAAEHLFEASDDEPIIVVGNAGAGIQIAGQLRQAFKPKAVAEHYFFDEDGSELFVATDSFPLGETGQEPTSTHQNPYTALGQIVRNAKILADTQQS